MKLYVPEPSKVPQVPLFWKLSETNFSLNGRSPKDALCYIVSLVKELCEYFIIKRDSEFMLSIEARVLTNERSLDDNSSALFSVMLFNVNGINTLEFTHTRGSRSSFYYLYRGFQKCFDGPSSLGRHHVHRQNASSAEISVVP